LNTALAGPLAVDQQGPHALGRVADKGPQHGLALGDEQALAADQVALLDVAIGRDARIVRIVDGDQIGHGALGTKAFSSEVDTGSREENASNQETSYRTPRIGRIARPPAAASPAATR
jgi:hypothetical protein